MNRSECQNVDPEHVVVRDFNKPHVRDWVGMTRSESGWLKHANQVVTCQSVSDLYIICHAQRPLTSCLNGKFSVFRVHFLLRRAHANNNHVFI